MFSKFVFLVGETALKGIKFQGKNGGGFIGVWERDSIKFSGVKEKDVDGPIWLLLFISELTDICFLVWIWVCTFLNYSIQSSPTGVLRVLGCLFVKKSFITNY